MLLHYGVMAGRRAGDGIPGVEKMAVDKQRLCLSMVSIPSSVHRAVCTALDQQSWVPALPAFAMGCFWWSEATAASPFLLFSPMFFSSLH